LTEYKYSTMFKIFENSSTTIGAGDYMSKKRDMAIFNGAERMRKCQNSEAKVFKGHEDYGNVRRGYIECLAEKAAKGDNHENELFDKNIKKTNLFDFFISKYYNDTGTDIDDTFFPYDSENLDAYAYEKYIRMNDFDKTDSKFRFKIIETMCRNHRFMNIFGQSEKNKIERTLEAIPELKIFDDYLEDDLFEAMMFDQENQDNDDEDTKDEKLELLNVVKELTDLSYQYEYEKLLDDDVDDTVMLLDNLIVFS